MYLIWLIFLRHTFTIVRFNNTGVPLYSLQRNNSLHVVNAVTADWKWSLEPFQTGAYKPVTTTVYPISRINEVLSSLVKGDNIQL